MHREHNGKQATRDKQTRSFVPDRVCIPMGMHLGPPSEPCVKEGDYVRIGQVIGTPVGGLGLPVHASVSGVVTAVGPHPYTSAQPMVCVSIDNDHKDEWTELAPLGDVESVDPALIIPQVKEAGICGMGGACFPTHVKLTLPEGKHCDTVIINGAECETFLTADDRLMREEPKRIIDGLRAVLRALNVKRGIIAIEDNKPEAIAVMTKAAAGREGVEVLQLPTKYPQGGEKQLIKAVTDREVPCGMLPIEVHTIVLNTGTVAAIADAVMEGKPLVSRIATVTGHVKNPDNLQLPIGALVSDVVAECGGYSQDPAMIVLGGGMTGVSIAEDGIPIGKATNGIVVYNAKEAATREEKPCIRCSRCVYACPMGLMPYQMKYICEDEDLELAQKWDVMDCIVCGSCSYVCPANRRLSEVFKVTKDKITLSKRKGA